MCISISKSFKTVIIRKEKLRTFDVNVEVVSINPWSVDKMISALQNVVQLAPVKIQFDGYTVRLPFQHKYVSIKSKDGMIFIPVAELGKVITGISNLN